MKKKKRFGVLRILKSVKRWTGWIQGRKMKAPPSPSLRGAPTLMAATTTIPPLCNLSPIATRSSPITFVLHPWRFSCIPFCFLSYIIVNNQMGSSLIPLNIKRLTFLFVFFIKAWIFFLCLFIN